MENERKVRIGIGILIFIVLVAIRVKLTLTSDKSSKKSAIIIATSIIVSAFVAYFSTELFGYIGIIEKLFPGDSTTTTVSHTTESFVYSTNTNIDEENITDTISKISTFSTREETPYTENTKIAKEDVTSEATTTKMNRSVKLYCKSAPLSFTDKNAEINAITSFDAQKVIIVCETENKNYGSWPMTTQNLRNWSFDACFYEANTYIITAKAYVDDTNYVSDSIKVTYPFS